MIGKSSPTLKSPEEIRIMDEANAIVWNILEKVASAVAPGISTQELDQLAERECLAAGAVPTFKGYGGYPKSICISLNDVIVHGIPSPRVVIKSGDVVSIDFGVTWLGFCGDAALTVAVGNVPPNALNLIRVTRECLDRAVEQCRPGQRVGDIGHAVQTHAEKHGLAVVRDFVGHGIGRSMHEPPQVPNYGSPGEGPALEPGMVLAIEPMICEGSYRVTVDEDGWTARTADGALAAHFEYSVAVTAAGPRVLGAGSR